MVSNMRIRKEVQDMITSLKRSIGQYRRQGYNIEYDFSRTRTRRQVEWAKQCIQVQVLEQKYKKAKADKANLEDRIQDLRDTNIKLFLSK